MRRIYVASSWRNEQQPVVINALRRAGHKVYDFREPWPGQKGFSWRELAPEWQQWTPVQYRKILLTHPTAAHGFLTDIRAMKWADTCVMVRPCGRSAHLELGWMAGAGKYTVILLAQQPEEPELMALLADDICLSIDEVLEKLK